MRGRAADLLGQPVEESLVSSLQAVTVRTRFLAGLGAKVGKRYALDLGASETSTGSP